MLWQISKVLFISSNLITRTFLAFFIWETKNNLGTVLIFSLAYFAAIPIASLVSGFISDSIEPKIAILLGTWMQIFQLFGLLIYGENLSLEMIGVIALMGGFAEGLKNVSEKVIDHEYSQSQDITKVIASRTFIKESLHLLLPLSIAYIISTGGSYLPAFKITIFILILNALSITFFAHKHARNSFNLIPIANFPGTNRDKLLLVKAVFIEGLSEGITFTILPIILLTFVGSLLNWGLLNTSLVLLSIVVSFLFNKFATDLNFKFVYATGAFLFAIASIFFLTQFNFFVIIVFLVVKGLMDVIKETGYYASLERIIEEDRRQYKLYAEYQFLVETVTAIGRLIPIVILIYMGINIHDEIIIRLAFLMIGVLPLITLSFLGQTAVFDENYEMKDKIGPVRDESTPTLSN